MENNNLKLALIMGVEEEISEYYDASYGLEHRFSKRYERQKKRIIQHADEMANDRGVVRRAHARPTFRRAVAIAAVIVLMLASASTVLAIVKPEIFYNIKEKIIDWTITFDSTNTEDTAFEYIVPPVPDGYEIVAEDKGPASYLLTFRNKDGQEIGYEQYTPEGTAIGLDNEQAHPRKEMIGDQEIVIWEKDQYVAIIFTDDRYVYDIDGNCGLETVHDVVEKMLER
jgi:hypothetical protein